MCEIQTLTLRVKCESSVDYWKFNQIFSCFVGDVQLKYYSQLHNTGLMCSIKKHKCLRSIVSPLFMIKLCTATRIDATKSKNLSLGRQTIECAGCTRWLPYAWLLFLYIFFFASFSCFLFLDCCIWFAPVQAPIILVFIAFAGQNSCIWADG